MLSINPTEVSHVTDVGRHFPQGVLAQSARLSLGHGGVSALNLETTALSAD